jgi:hypothetical protein
MSSSVSVTVDPLNSKNSFLFLLFMSSFSLYPSSHYYAAVLRSEKVIELFGWWTTYPRPNVACCSYSYISNSHFSFCNYVIKRIDGTLPKYLFVYLSVAYFTTLFVTDIIYRLYIAYLRSWILFTFFFFQLTLIKSQGEHISFASKTEFSCINSHICLVKQILWNTYGSIQIQVSFLDCIYVIFWSSLSGNASLNVLLIVLQN